MWGFAEGGTCLCGTDGPKSPGLHVSAWGSGFGSVGVRAGGEWALPSAGSLAGERRDHRAVCQVCVEVAVGEPLYLSGLCVVTEKGNL